MSGKKIVDNGCACARDISHFFQIENRRDLQN